MKKILAMLLAVMMLLGMVAMAEEADPAQSALICGFENIMVDVTANGQTQSIDLSELVATGVIDTEDTLRFVGQVDKGDENLIFGVAELVGDKLHYSMSGAERTFEADLPEQALAQMGGQDHAVLVEMLRSALPALLAFKLPQLGAISLPKADLSSLVGLFASDTSEADGTTTMEFSIPSEIVTMLIQQLGEAVKGTAGNIPQGDQIAAVIDQLQSSGLSFALNGTLADNGDEQTVALSIHMAQENEVAEDPVLILNTYSAVDNFTLGIDLPSEDGSYTIGQLTAVTNPDEETLDIGLDIAGMASFVVNFYKADGMQHADVAFDAGDFHAGLNFVYGTQEDGVDYYALSGSSDTVGSFEIVMTESADENGAYGGDFSFAIEASEQNIEVTGDYFAYIDDYDMGGYTLPEEVVPASEITQEESQAATQPLMEYLNSLMGAQPAA